MDGVKGEMFIAEDPLTYLPRKAVQQWGKGTVIYSPQQPSDRLHLAVVGRVKVSATSEDGRETISRLVSAEGIFGESALLGGRPSETALALDAVTLMSWTRAEIELQIEREPKLGLALAQYLIGQCISLQERLESMSLHKTPERVMIALLRLARMLGAPAPDSSARFAWLTHRTIAEYVGTSREIITYQMNRLRRLGLIRYTRRHIDVDTSALVESLRQKGIRMPEAIPESRGRGLRASGGTP
jgi:CRP/FNR family cyclic AMP-dependent transcriptional regulator